MIRTSTDWRRIDGQLFEDVTFGWGFLARLNKGGTFRVTQREVAPGHWEIVGLDVNMSGHAILFKNINVKQHEVKSEFRRVPDSLTMAQAYQLLEKDDGAVSATAAPVEYCTLSSVRPEKPTSSSSASPNHLLSHKLFHPSGARCAHLAK